MSDDQEKMAVRLDSLRASIRSSKPLIPSVSESREPEVEPEPAPDWEPQPEPQVEENATFVRHISDFVSVEGTPLYMSPEQCENNAATSHTDVYSLGVMMFELLEGHPPYVAGTVDEVLFMHLDAPIPEQLSTFTPDEVKSLVARMLAKNPIDRPEMHEVVATLQLLVNPAAADVMGLEEESWTVTEIETTGSDELPPSSQTAEIASAASPTQATFFNSPLENRGVDATWDALEEEGETSKPPIWIFGLLAFLVCGLLALLFVVGGDDDSAPSEVANSEPEVVEEPAVVPEPRPEVDAVAVGEPDAGVEPEVEGGELAVEEPMVEEPVVEEPVVEEPEPDPEPAPKQKRKPRKQRKPKLQELRL